MIGLVLRSNTLDECMDDTHRIAGVVIDKSIGTEQWTSICLGTAPCKTSVDIDRGWIDITACGSVGDSTDQCHGCAEAQEQKLRTHGQCQSRNWMTAATRIMCQPFSNKRKISVNRAAGNLFFKLRRDTEEAQGY